MLLASQQNVGLFLKIRMLGDLLSVSKSLALIRSNTYRVVAKG